VLSFFFLAVPITSMKKQDGSTLPFQKLNQINSSQCRKLISRAGCFYCCIYDFVRSIPQKAGGISDSENLNLFFHVMLAFISSRVLLLCSGYLGYSLYISKQETLPQIFCRWDCDWYLTVIKNGYDLIPHGHYNQDAAN
jgi:hypothetical protein